MTNSLTNALAQSQPWAGVDLGAHLFLFSPMIALVAAMLLIVTAPIILGRGARLAANLTTVGVAAALILTLRVGSSLPRGGVSGLSTDPGAGLLIVDSLSVAFQVLLLVFAAGILWLWWMGPAETERNAPEFFILLLGSAVGMMLMAGTANLLMIVVAIETASIPSYALVGFDKRDRRAAEASLKYMIFGAACAAIMLYGVSLLYGLTGSLSFADVARYTADHAAAGPTRLLLVIGLLCFFVGIAFKISAVPFHFWCPDAFEGARVEVTTWLSVVSKAAGLLLLARLVAMLCGAVDHPVQMPILAPLAWTIGIIAAITCTVGNFAAYGQSSVKRLLAYSSIAHAGYMMMAAAVFLHPSVKNFSAGMNALLFYVVVYLFMNLGAFGVTAIVNWRTGSDRIEAFTGLMRRAPGLTVAMVICLVSLVGLPPLAGFLGKWWILVALGQTNSVLGWFLVVVAVLNTLISLYFYMRVVVRMTLADDGRPAFQGVAGGTALASLCAAMLLVLFVFAHPVKEHTRQLSGNLYGPSAGVAQPVAAAPAGEQ